MTNDECQMTNEIRNPKVETRMRGIRHSSFGIRHPSFLTSSPPQRSSAFHHVLQLFQDWREFGLGLSGTLAVKGLQTYGSHFRLEFVAEDRRGIRPTTGSPHSASPHFLLR